jgi:putative membrane protein
MRKRVVWVAVCAFAGLALSFAGLSSARTGQNTNSSGAGGQGNMNRGGGRGSMSGGAVSSRDRKFVMNAAMGDMFEIESSRLALERAAGDQVRRMAQQLIDDHTRTSGELMQLAQPKGLTPPAALDTRHAAMLSRLRNLSGAAFDREYLRLAGVRAHEQAVKLFRDQSRKGSDADLRAFAARTLPALEGHLQMARSHSGMGGMHGGGMMNSNGGGMGGSMNGNMNNMNGNMNRNTNRNSNSNAGGGNRNNSNR